MFKVTRLGHMGIHVRDLDRSIKFYEQVMGFTLTGRWEAGEPNGPPTGVAFMRCNSMHHDLVLFPLPPAADVSPGEPVDSVHRPQCGVHHMAFEVQTREDFLEALRYVQDQGSSSSGGPSSTGSRGMGSRGGAEAMRSTSWTRTATASRSSGG